MWALEATFERNPKREFEKKGEFFYLIDRNPLKSPDSKK